MAETFDVNESVLGDQACEQCICKAGVLIGYDVEGDPDADPPVEDSIEWYEVPATLSITENISDSTGTEKRHSHSGCQFLIPCNTEGRTRTFDINSLYCNVDPLDCYLRDGRTYRFRLLRDITLCEGDEGYVACHFTGKVNAGGKVWSNETRDGEERSWSLEPTGDIENFYPTCPDGTPFADNPEFVEGEDEEETEAGEGEG